MIEVIKETVWYNHIFSYEFRARSRVLLARLSLSGETAHSVLHYIRKVQKILKIRDRPSKMAKISCNTELYWRRKNVLAPCWLWPDRPFHAFFNFWLVRKIHQQHWEESRNFTERTHVLTSTRNGACGVGKRERRIPHARAPRASRVLQHRAPHTTQAPATLYAMFR